MESLFQQLKKARESQGRSIEDIAAATRISPEILRNLENGRTDMLPQAYIRAFLREYADMVGLNPEEVMARYESGERRPSAPPPPIQQPAPAPATRITDAPKDLPPTAKKPVYAIALTAIVLGAIVYWNLSRPSPPGETVIPVLQGSPVDTTAKDTTAVSPKPLPDRRDSLTLVAVTTDTVWLKIVPDSRKPLQYRLPPNARRTWKAKDRFTISIGRPEAIAMTLNDTPLGKMGGKGRSVLDSVLTRATLDALRQREQRK